MIPSRYKASAQPSSSPKKDAKSKKLTSSLEIASKDGLGVFHANAAADEPVR